MVMRCFRTFRKGSVNLEILPAVLFACSLEDRSFGERFGFPGLRDRLVEVATVSGLFGGGQCRCRRGPLIAQRSGLFVGGFCRGIGGLEVGFGAGGQS
jgi:hypothetical protein